MEQAELALSHHQGRDVVFSANLKHPMAPLLTEFLKKDAEMDQVNSSARTEDENDLMENLARLGAPLPFTKGTGLFLSPEETVVRALKLAHKNSTVARVVPLVLFKSRERLDFETLKNRAVSAGERKALGFFLDLTSELSADSKFKSRARQLRDKRMKRVESFFVNSSQGKFAKLLEQRNTPAVAKRWQFSMNMPLDSFASHFRKFA
jgi:hypothetical protein